MSENIFSPSNIRKATMTKIEVRKALNNTGERIREPLKAEIKNEVRKRAGNKCEWRGCNYKEDLEFHHINQERDKDKLSNIQILCPNHHAKTHRLHKRITTERNFIGRGIKFKVVTREQAQKIKENKKKTEIDFTDKYISGGY